MPIAPILLPADVLNPILPPALPKPPEVPRIEPAEVPSAGPSTSSTPVEVILVGGVNFPHKRGKVTNGFGGYCATYAEDLDTVYSAGVKVTVFSFYDGTLEEWKVSGKTIKRTVIKNLGKLDANNYRFTVDRDGPDEKYVIKEPSGGGNTLYFTGISDIDPKKDVTKVDYLKAFKKGSLTEASISIADVYNYIEALGKSAKGSLKELHIFSHAWIGGPILANTREYWDSGTWLNDGKYLDKDGRSEDFDSGITILKNIADFRAAFAKDGFSMIWGCNAFGSPKQIVNQTRKSKLYKEMVKDPDKQLLELTFNSDDWGLDTVAEFHDLVKDAKPYSTKKTSDKKSLNEIIAILQAILDDTYMQKLATGTDAQVLGALPGTYANLDQSYQKSHGRPLMHIPMGKPFSDYVNEKDKKQGFVDFRPILKFYADHLGVTFKPGKEYDKVTYGRGYGVYLP